MLAAANDDLTDAVVILGVVLLNAVLGFYQEYRAERSLAALRGMLAPEAEVRRDGQRRMIRAEDLVPGDIVLLDGGDRVRVPADGRLLFASGLEVEESALTGADRRELAAANGRLAAQGTRVIATASGSIAAEQFDPEGPLEPHIRGLTFEGLVGLMDPPRPEVKETIALCRRAGIGGKMITGDQRITAEAMARELGMEGAVLDGAALNALSEEELAERIGGIGVFARAQGPHRARPGGAGRGGGRHRGRRQPRPGAAALGHQRGHPFGDAWKETDRRSTPSPTAYPSPLPSGARNRCGSGRIPG
ncbi:hypothetical protein [Thiohalorhabdus methylotrophus]|uniref:P-type ATPase A domain-containing protein n=1 Tax=Thiohalorhabdus methylotrophus TaxID=3242694 RepID=A0ABV4U0S9_9GAMM